MEATAAAQGGEGHLVGLLQRAHDALAEVTAHVSSMGDLGVDRMLEAAELAGAVHRLSEAVMVRTVDAVQAQERRAAPDSSLAARCGFRDAAGLLIALTGASRPTLKRWQRLALATSPRSIGSTGILPPLLPHLAEALDAGLLSVDQAGVIRQHLIEASSRAHPDHLDAAERALVAGAVGLAASDGDCGGCAGESCAGESCAGEGCAGEGCTGDRLAARVAGLGRDASLVPLSPQQLGTLARGWQAAIDPDGPEPTYDQQRQQRSFSLGRRSDGMWVGKLLLPPEQGEALRLALDAHNAPRAKARFDGDVKADMGGDADTDASGSSGTDVGGTGSSETGSSGTALGGTASSSTGSGGTDSAGGSDADSAGAGLSRRGRLDDRTTPQRQADTLVGLITAAMAQPGAPTVGGNPAGVVVTITEAALARHAETGGGTARLEHSGEIVPAHVAAKIICDGYLQSCVLNDDGLPLKLGRSRRLHTNHQRRAILTAYPGGCLNQHCDAPPGFTEIHHPVWWGNSGDTDVDNGIPVCQHCHIEIHAGRLRCVQDETERWHVEPTFGRRTWRGSAIAHAS